MRCLWLKVKQMQLLLIRQVTENELLSLNKKLFFFTDGEQCLRDNLTLKFSAG